MSSPLERMTANLARLATHYDITGDWPETSLDILTAAGAWTWVVPERFGGLGLDPVRQTQAYEAVAAGCMSTLLILTQRDGACEFIAESENESLQNEMLPRLAAHEIFVTVGISQITTSRQGGKPALVAHPQGNGFCLHGFMPWVTGAVKCQYIVTAAVLPDGRQILATVPVEAPGVQIDRPMDLMALQSSLTSEVHCRDVRLERRLVLRGPTDKVLASRSTVKPLVVSTAGIGLAGTIVKLIKHYAEAAEGRLLDQAEELEGRHAALRDRLYKAATMIQQPGAEVQKTELRIAVNDLLARLAVAVLTFAKGSGFIRQRDAQRLVREALFFLVWSAPEDVRAGTLEGFLQQPPPEIRTMSRE